MVLSAVLTVGKVVLKRERLVAAISIEPDWTSTPVQIPPIMIPEEGTHGKFGGTNPLEDTTARVVLVVVMDPLDHMSTAGGELLMLSQ